MTASMDNVLFYGKGDDASRRQVRSAAAQHSHRSGSRKPKKTSSSGASASALGNGNGNAHGTGNGSETNKQRASVKKRPAHHQKTTSSSTASSSSDAGNASGIATLATSPGGTPSPPTVKQMNDRVSFGLSVTSYNNKTAACQNTWDFNGQPPDRASPTSTSLPSKASPPTDRFGQPSTTIGQNTTFPPPRRLPQYSWTEYPRYGMNSSHPHPQPPSFQSLGHVTAASNEPFPAQEGSVSRLRQYKNQTTVEGPDRPRLQLPPLAVVSGASGPFSSSCTPPTGYGPPSSNLVIRQVARGPAPSGRMYPGQSVA